MDAPQAGASPGPTDQPARCTGCRSRSAPSGDVGQGFHRAQSHMACARYHTTGRHDADSDRLTLCSYEYHDMRQGCSAASPLLVVRYRIAERIVVEVAKVCAQLPPMTSPGDINRVRLTRKPSAQDARVACQNRRARCLPDGCCKFIVSPPSSQKRSPSLLHQTRRSEALCCRGTFRDDRCSGLGWVCDMSISERLHSTVGATRLKGVLDRMARSIRVPGSSTFQNDRRAVSIMEHRGVGYLLAQTSDRKNWAWTVHLDPQRTRAGVSFSKDAATLNAEREIDKALMGLWPQDT